MRWRKTTDHKVVKDRRQDRIVRDPDQKTGKARHAVPEAVAVIDEVIEVIVDDRGAGARIVAPLGDAHRAVSEDEAVAEIVEHREDAREPDLVTVDALHHVVVIAGLRRDVHQEEEARHEAVFQDPNAVTSCHSIHVTRRLKTRNWN